MSTKPFPVTLDQTLALIDQVLGIDAMLADDGQDRLAVYYAQSRIGYDRLHSGQGCMHVALNPSGRFDRAGFLAQAQQVGRQIEDVQAGRVLELGAGLGFNTRHLARAHPGTDFMALDLLPAHVDQITRRSHDAGTSNITACVGEHSALPPGLGRFEVIFAVETLCYARDPARVAAEIAAHLAPGGRFILFDPFAARPERALRPQLALATRLYRLGVALAEPLHSPQEWREALTGAGLALLDDSDLTLQALPGLRKMQQVALTRTDTRLRRLALRALPRYLARNAATALTGPFVCFGTGPRPEPGAGSITYRRLIFERPAG